jgi:hypothetical protein
MRFIGMKSYIHGFKIVCVLHVAKETTKNETMHCVTLFQL